jgi:hypothetical protein
MGQDGRSIGFALFEVPSLRLDKPFTVREGARYVDHASTLGWAVLETNRLELQHRLDFAVLTMDLKAFTPDPKEAAAEVARLARGLTVKRIYLVAGPYLRSEEMRKRYALFVPALRRSLANHEVVDLSGKTDRRNEFTLIGLNTGALATDAEAGHELARVGRDMADRQTTVLFAVIEKLPKDGKLEAGSLWAGKSWASIVKRPNLVAIFLSVLSGTPQTGPSFPAPGKKVPVSLVRVAPRLDPAGDDPVRGLLYARAARDGNISAAPSWMAAPGEPIELENTMQEAVLKEGNGEYKAAFDLYEEALKSKDVHIRAGAGAGLRRTNEALQGNWERWKSELAVVRWEAPSVRVDMASKLGTEAPAEKFMMHIIDGANVIPAIWVGIPDRMPSSRGLDVELKTETGQNVVSELEGLKIPGVDVQAIVKWLLFIWRYASWRLEMTVFGTAAQTGVYARLRFAWYTKRVYMEPVSTAGDMDVKTAAWTLICDLIVDGVALR